MPAIKYIAEETLEVESPALIARWPKQELAVRSMPHPDGLATVPYVLIQDNSGLHVLR
jgi:hypothetical protein